MGVVISAKPFIWRELPVLRLFLLLLLVIAVLTAYSLFAHGKPPKEDWSVVQLANALQEGQISRLTLNVNGAVAETAAGTHAVIIDPPQQSVLEALKPLGITQKHLRNVEINPQGPSSTFGPAQLLQSFCSVPIVILVLGSGSIVFLRTRQRRPGL